MNARAAVELVVANIALVEGIVNGDVYSAIVFMAMITALTTPILLTKFGGKYI